MANRNIFIVLYLDRVTFITDMNNNENTVKYCLNIANEICAGGASLLAEAVFVCIDFLKIFCKKCVENLAVTKNCVISLSLSSLRAKYTKYHLIFNGLLITFSSKNHRIRSIPLSRLSIIRLQYVYGGMRQHGYVMSAYRLFYGYVTGNPVLTKIK